MPFDWYHPHRVPRPQQAVSRATMYRRELAERAALLRRLGHDRQSARKRLLANADWDFEVGTGDNAVTAEDVERILDEAYSRGGPASGGAPSL